MGEKIEKNGDGDEEDEIYQDLNGIFIVLSVNMQDIDFTISRVDEFSYLKWRNFGAEEIWRKWCKMAKITKLNPR